MKKVGIVTIIDNDNYGNRLQNYALQETISKAGFDVTTIKNDKRLNHQDSFKARLRKYIKFVRNRIGTVLKGDKNRKRNFKKFNKNIKFSKKIYTSKSKDLKQRYDFFVVGSDQVWKPTYDRMSYFDLLGFAESKQKIAYAPSFGISEIDTKYHKFLRDSLSDFKDISVREKRGAEIIKEISGRDAILVLDPTLLLSREEWEKVEKTVADVSGKRYILTYFLGENIHRNEITSIAQENNMEVINLMDKDDKYYKCGPSEFLYLFKNASLVYTDSFHACVFSTIYEKPFFVFSRAQKGMNNMNSRLESFLELIRQEKRYITSLGENEEIFKCDYTESKNIIKKERDKSINYLKNALDIKDGV